MKCNALRWGLLCAEFDFSSALPREVEAIKFKIVFNGEMKVESVIRIPKQLLKTSHYHIFFLCETDIRLNIEGMSWPLFRKKKPATKSPSLLCNMLLLLLQQA